MRILRGLIFSFLLFFLAACGGSGGSVDAPVESPQTITLSPEDSIEVVVSLESGSLIYRVDEQRPQNSDLIMMSVASEDVDFSQSITIESVSSDLKFLFRDQIITFDDKERTFHLSSEQTEGSLFFSLDENKGVANFKPFFQKNIFPKYIVSSKSMNGQQFLNQTNTFSFNEDKKLIIITANTVYKEAVPTLSEATLRYLDKTLVQEMTYTTPFAAGTCEFHYSEDSLSALNVLDDSDCGYLVEFFFGLNFDVINAPDPVIPTPDPAVPTPDPVVPTPGPVIPTPDPVVPTPDPVVPTPDPVIPTPDPVIPTPDPVVPTPDPVVPTPDPVIPTPDPVIPTPDPVIPTPDPVIPTPDPVIPTPDPVVPTPDPVIPTPDPVVPTPDPVVPTPDPVVPTPDPVVPTPDPVVPTPDPVVPTPDPVVPTPDPVVPTPDPVIPTPDPVVPAPDPGTTLPFIEVPISDNFNALNRDELVPLEFKIKNDFVYVYQDGANTEIVIENLFKDGSGRKYRDSYEYFFYNVNFKFSEQKNGSSLLVTDEENTPLFEINPEEKFLFAIQNIALFIDELGYDGAGLGFAVNNVFPLKSIHTDRTGVQTTRIFSFSDEESTQLDRIGFNLSNNTFSGLVSFNYSNSRLNIASFDFYLAGSNGFTSSNGECQFDYKESNGNVEFLGFSLCSEDTFEIYKFFFPN